MSGHAPDFTATLKTIPGRQIPGTVKTACIVGIVIGLATAGYGFVGGDANLTHRAQGTFVTNFMYWNGIAMGGFIFSTIGMITYARWQRRFKRISEAFSVFLPVSYALLLLFLVLGGIKVYPWSHEAMPAHKAVYFDTTFFYLRQIIGIGLLIFFSRWFTRISLRADIGVARVQMKEMGLEVPGHWEKICPENDWKGEETEVAEAQQKMMTLSPIFVVLYATVVAMISVDISMSLAPHFFTNMFPAWYSMSAAWSGLVWTSIFAITCGDWLGTKNLTRRKDFHDIGKLTFAFCMFWGYTTLAQYLPIWYGNMTEEIGFILYRTHGEVFGGMTQLMMVICFAAPYTILFSRGIKKIPAAFLAVCVLMAIGLWLERYITNMPSVHSYFMEETGLPLGIVEIGMTLGFLGLFVLIIMNFLSKYPGSTLSDPYMHDDPEHIEIHVAHH